MEGVEVSEHAVDAHVCMQVALQSSNCLLTVSQGFASEDQM